MPFAQRAQQRKNVARCRFAHWNGCTWQLWCNVVNTRHITTNNDVWNEDTVHIELFCCNLISVFFTHPLEIAAHWLHITKNLHFKKYKQPQLPMVPSRFWLHSVFSQRKKVMHRAHVAQNYGLHKTVFYSANVAQTHKWCTEFCTSHTNTLHSAHWAPKTLSKNPTACLAKIECVHLHKCAAISVWKTAAHKAKKKYLFKNKKQQHMMTKYVSM